MGRHAQGWKLEWRRGIGYVRFTHEGHQHLISTGKRNPGEAVAEAARLYARVIGGGVARPASTRALVLASLDVLLAKWIATLDGTLDPETIRTYETTYVGKHWIAHFDTIEDMCSEVARERYRAARLKAATAQTVKKETWVQDKFLRWCKQNKVIGSVPPPLEWESKTLGTRTGPQRERARELTTDQVAVFLTALPAWREVGKRARIKKPFPVRDRFIVSYDTGLRPATISALRWSDWKGATLVIRDEADKIRYGREVPLSEQSQVAIERVRQDSIERGRSVEPDATIFGDHEHGKTIARAAAIAGLDGVAPYDLRHARATHLADAGAAITGIGFLVGHKQATTTNRYLHQSRKAAEMALATTEFAGNSGSNAHPDLESPEETRVTDGVRTRDIWSHKAPVESQNLEKRSDVGSEPPSSEAAENRTKRIEVGPGPRIASASARAFRAQAWLQLGGGS